MIEIFNLILNLFSQFIEFLDSFYIIGTISILRILIILFLFRIALLFLLKNNKNKE